MSPTTKQNRPSLFGPDCILYSPLSDIAGIQQEGWVVNGTPTVEETPFGKGLDFIRTSNEYLNLGPRAFDVGASSFSICVLLYPRFIDNYHGIITQRNAGDANYWQLVTVNTNTFGVILDDGPSYRELYGVNNSMPLNTWSFITAVIDKSGANLGRCYRNGTNVTLANTNYVGVGAPYVTGRDIRIGWEQANNDYFDGIMKWIWVFLRPISLAEHQQMNNMIFGAA